MSDLSGEIKLVGVVIDQIMARIININFLPFAEYNIRHR